MEKPNSNLQIETLIQNNDFQKGYKGMLFRKKKHNEIKNVQTNNNTSDKAIKSNYKEPTPTLSSKQYRPVPVNNALQNEINNNIKVKNNSQQITEEHQLNKQVHSDTNNQEDSFIDMSNSSKQNNSQQKENNANNDLIIKHILEETKQQLIEYKNIYNKKYINILIQKIANKCQKYLKKNKEKKRLEPTITMDLQLKTQFTKETSIINNHLVVINILLDISSQCNTYLEKNNNRLSNLCLIYWINYFILQINSTLFKEANLRIEHPTKGMVKQNDIKNLRNQQKDNLLHQIYDILSGYKKKFLIDKRLNNFADNFFNNAMYEILKTQNIPFLKQLYIINLDSNKQTHSTIFNNKSYLHNQKDFKEKNNAIKTYIEDNQRKLTKAKIDMYKLSQRKELFNTTLSSKIISFNVYYLNISTLIEDFCSCED